MAYGFAVSSMRPVDAPCPYQLGPVDGLAALS